jgi:hypothetical protein
MIYVKPRLSNWRAELGILKGVTPSPSGIREAYRRKALAALGLPESNGRTFRQLLSQHVATASPRAYRRPLATALTTGLSEVTG